MCIVCVSVSLCGVHACLWLTSLANRSVHAAQWSSSCVLWRAAGPGWAWRSSWRGSAATSRVPSGRKRKASAFGVAARRTRPLAVTHLLKRTIFAPCRYWATAADTWQHLSSEFAKINSCNHIMWFDLSAFLSCLFSSPKWGAEMR